VHLALSADGVGVFSLLFFLCHWRISGSMAAETGLYINNIYIANICDGKVVLYLHFLHRVLHLKVDRERQGFTFLHKFVR